MAQEYVIYCDESDDRGRHYSNFYGGALVRSEHLDEIMAALAAKKHELHLNNEVKWTRISENYESKYRDLLDFFFDFIAVDKIKIRIMFTHNTVVAKNLTATHIEEKYFILYYQFIKHAFGLAHSPMIKGGIDLRIYPDKLPDTAEQVEKFRSFLVSLSRNVDFRQKEIRILRENVAEVDSSEHDILQCLDVIVGAMSFRLNDKHKDKMDGKRVRGKRTRAKERIYRRINERIRELHPNFNIGITTGTRGDIANRWHQSYRHWLFMPTDREVRPGSKHKK